MFISPYPDLIPHVQGQALQYLELHLDIGRHESCYGGGLLKLSQMCD